MHRALFPVALAAMASVAVAGSGQLIAIDSNRNFYDIDPLTGFKTLLGTASANASTTAGLAYNRANGQVYLTSTGNDSLFTLDIGTGTATLIGTYSDTAVFMHGLEFDGAGNLWGVSSHNNGLYSIDKNNGSTVLIGTSGLASFTNLGWNPTNNTMYATNSGADSSYTMNLANGMTTLLGPLNGPTNPNGLAWHSGLGRMYFVDNSTDNLYYLDLVTGAGILVGSTGSGNLLGLVYIPTPGAASVLGIAALAGLRRRR